MAVELVQLQSTSSRSLAVATRESARLVNVKGLAAFRCVGVKRSVDLNRRFYWCFIDTFCTQQ